MKTPSELIKEKYPFYDNGKVTHDVELCGEQVEELMLLYADEVVKNNVDLADVSDSLVADNFYLVRMFSDDEFEPAKACDYYGHGTLYFRFTNGAVRECKLCAEYKPLCCR